MDTLLLIYDITKTHVICRRLGSKKMKETGRNLSEVTSKLHIPKIIKSDNGFESVNELIQELTNLIGVDHRTI